MKYEAIFCDFDGTLLADDFKISKLNRQAIKEYIDFGGKFIISTGRLFQSIYPHLIDLGITKGKVIVSQGSCIYDIETKQLVYEKTITKEHTLAIADYVESQMEKYPNRIVNVVYIDDNCWTISKNPYVDKLCSLIKVQPQFTEMEISKFFKTHDVLPTKFLSIVDSSLVDEYMSTGRKILGEDYFFCRSREFLVEIQETGVDKGTGVKNLCKLENIPIEKTICIGDSDNDEAMLKVAGLAVAVENAYDNVKKVADYVAPSCNDDAIYDVIHKFCLDKV